MKSNSINELETVLDWCARELGAVAVSSDHTREHAGERAAATRLQTSAGACFLKIHHDRMHWESEVHAYEQWAPAFGSFAPRLLAVREVEPLALVISEVPGKTVEDSHLEEAQKEAIWRAAGKALAPLHRLGAGESFGPCRRDGTVIGARIDDAREYLSNELEGWLEKGKSSGAFRSDELAIVRAARALLPSFEGERPVPCHRDYCLANWLASDAGTWAGVIDFEFAYWDVWVTDFARDAFWTWVEQPALMEAFREGYGRIFTEKEAQQLLFAHTLFAAAAIAWGEENDYHVFAGEGRRSLVRVGELLA